MLISEKSRFIFIHVYKNAGQSITTALLPFAATDMQLKINEVLKNKCGVNFLYPLSYNRDMHINDFTSKGLNFLFRKVLLFFHLPPQPFRDHITAQELLLHLGKDKYNSCFSFGVVRNPWDWQVSIFHYVKQNPFIGQQIKNMHNFDEYIRWRCSHEIRFQKDFLFSQDGNLLVDFIAKYETIQNDFLHICQQIGIKSSLPSVNQSKHKAYQEYYSDETIELVRKAFAEDIELFNYEF